LFGKNCSKLNIKISADAGSKQVDNSQDEATSMEDFLINANYLLNQLVTFGEVAVEMCYVRCFTTKISSFWLINLNLERLAHV
jgi:hypothetical protein